MKHQILATVSAVILAVSANVAIAGGDAAAGKAKLPLVVVVTAPRASVHLQHTQIWLARKTKNVAPISAISTISNGWMVLF